MKIRGLLIAAVILGALSGLLYWSDHHKPKDAQASTDTQPKIWSLNEGDITKLDVKKKSAPDLVLTKDSAGKWQMDAPERYSVDQSAVSGMLTNLTSLNAERVVEDKATNLSTYGLSDPSLQLDVTEKNNQSRTLLLGDETPTGSAMYAKLSGDPRVFTVGTWTKNTVDKSPNDLRDKRLITLDADKVSRVELNQKNDDLEFGRDKNQWQILKPKPMRANSTEVDDLVRKLADAKMDLSGSADDLKKSPAAFNSGTPVATAKITGDAGAQELQVRKNKNDYYAKSSVVAGVYKVPVDVGQELSKKLEDFRNKKLFDFGFEDPNQIEIHDGANAYYLMHSNEGWWSNGKTMDPGGVGNLVDKLRDLSASKFVDSGFTQPAITLVVKSDDNKRV